MAGTILTLRLKKAFDEINARSRWLGSGWKGTLWLSWIPSIEGVVLYAAKARNWKYEIEIRIYTQIQSIRSLTQSLSYAVTLSFSHSVTTPATRAVTLGDLSNRSV